MGLLKTVFKLRPKVSPGLCLRPRVCSELEPLIVEPSDSWDSYVQRMADPFVWGGEPEMVRAAASPALIIYYPQGNRGCA